ncbi:MAG: YfiR family protein [Pontixanthobacter sp.]
MYLRLAFPTKRIVLLAGLIFAASQASNAHAQAIGATKIAMADIQLGQSDETAGGVVRRTVRSIVDYSRFPEGRTPRTLCVVGRSKYGSHLGDIGLANGTRLSSKIVSASTFDFAGCDIVYLGQMAMQQMRNVTSAVRGKSVLTIAENDPECRSRSMFCLVFTPSSLSFKLDIDAISRSGVRVDPRVLRLSKSEDS